MTYPSGSVQLGWPLQLGGLQIAVITPPCPWPSEDTVKWTSTGGLGKDPAAVHRKKYFIIIVYTHCTALHMF